MRIIAIISLMLVSVVAMSQMRPYVMRSKVYDELYVSGRVSVECKVDPDSAGLVVYRATDKAAPAVRLANVGTALHIAVNPADNVNVSRDISKMIVYLSGPMKVISLSGAGKLSIADAPCHRHVSLILNGFGVMRISSVKAEMANLSLSANGKIIIDGGLDADIVNCSLSGSGTMSIGNIKASALNVTLQGGGKVSLSGKSRRASYVVKGSGSIDACSISVDTAKAALYGDGRISYSGSTAVMSKSGNAGNILRESYIND